MAEVQGCGRVESAYDFPKSLFPLGTNHLMALLFTCYATQRPCCMPGSCPLFAPRRPCESASRRSRHQQPLPTSLSVGPIQCLPLCCILSGRSRVTLSKPDGKPSAQVVARGPLDSENKRESSILWGDIRPRSALIKMPSSSVLFKESRPLMYRERCSEGFDRYQDLSACR